jgi:hypothetical protein
MGAYDLRPCIALETCNGHAPGAFPFTSASSDSLAKRFPVMVLLMPVGMQKPESLSKTKGSFTPGFASCVPGKTYGKLDGLMQMFSGSLQSLL